MPGRTRRLPWRRCTAARQTCGRSTGRSSRPIRDAIEPPHRAIAEGRARVAVDPTDRALGFSVATPVEHGGCELDDLFVDPDSMGLGIGRLLVADLAARAAGAGASRVDVIANPNALGFYERVGFRVVGDVPTRFGRGIRMTLDLPEPGQLSRSRRRAARPS